MKELIRRKVSIVLGLLVVAVVFTLVQDNSFSTPETPPLPEINVAGASMALADGEKLALEVLTTKSEREKGLSGRESLPYDSGLLFVFEEEALHGFWMKEMNFDIDIIWLDSNYTVVGIKEDATPESFPKSFHPEKPARFVIETNTGFVDEQSISIGDTLDLSL